MTQLMSQYVEGGLSGDDILKKALCASWQRVMTVHLMTFVIFYRHI